MRCCLSACVVFVSGAEKKEGENTSKETADRSALYRQDFTERENRINPVRDQGTNQECHSKKVKRKLRVGNEFRASTCYTLSLYALFAWCNDNRIH